MEKILTILSLFFCFYCAIGLSPVHAQDSNQSLRIPLYSSTISLNPAGIQDQSSLWVSRQVNCQLIRSKGGVLSMEAAKTIQYTNEKILNVVLRDDVFFHDHSPVTSDDVIATFEFLRAHRSLFRSIFGWVNRIEKIDEKNLNFILDQTNSQFLNILSSPNYAILKKSFIETALKDSTLWEKPMGCGQYRIDSFDKNNHFVELSPVLPNFPKIRFDLLGENQISAEKIHDYDIVGLTVSGAVPESDYRVERIFDPYHIFLGLNTRLPEWQSKKNRCALFSKLDRENILKAYGDDAEAAKDIFPRGILGYNDQVDYPHELKTHDEKSDYHAPKKNICVSTLSVSIPLERRQLYSDMMKPFFANVFQQTLDDPKEFGKTFAESSCDALVLGLKSNVLDAYEYLLTLADGNDQVNFIGYQNSTIQEKIKASQDITDNARKAAAYREIGKAVREECLYYPVLTIPMKKIYVKNTRKTPGLGELPLNEYFLGQVQ